MRAGAVPLWAWGDRGGRGVSNRPKYRITLELHGVSLETGDEAARDITEAFLLNHPHEHNVICAFSNGILRLVAENDYDPGGLNLMDEFSDNICAYVSGAHDGDLRLVSVENLG